MSGGVDSSLCAHLLVEQGYDVTGVYMECWRAPGCRTEEDRADALKVALSLDIPFQVLDFKETYKQKVVENFFDEYEAGRTPNPDVLCNKEIKFGLFYDWAMENNFDYVATGHYAAISEKEGQKYLTIPKDKHKDQTYFLYLMQPEQLEHVLFPLADFTKAEARQLATQKELHVAAKKDSVGICFIGDIDVKKFLKDRLGENPGDVVDTEGNVIGQHNGLWFYTIGQRHGFTIDKKTVIKLDNGDTFEKQNIPPFYVIAKQPDKNQLVVGFGAETYQQQFSVGQLHFHNQNLFETAEKMQARIRHTGDLESIAKVEKTKTANNTQYKITLDNPIKGIAAGQSAVFYVDERIVAGGIIT